MQLTGELKEKVEKTETKEEAKDILEKAGVVLNDAELDQVAGGRYSRNDGQARARIQLEKLYR